MKDKKICVLYTGGTIGMLKTKHGYSPEKNWLTEKLCSIHLFQSDEVPSFEIIEYENLIDSSDSTPKDWMRIARDIYNFYDQYDGFVILHGTDTLSYTASALSFLLKGLKKTVICTGSQIPFSEVRTDALDNIIDSLIIAANFQLEEVCIYFNKKLYRGNRTQKVDCSSMLAFNSPNYPLLGTVGINININIPYLYHSQESKIQLELIGNPKIASLRLFPGMNFNIIEHLADQGLDGLIIKTYGSGNAPSSKSFSKLLKRVSDDGTIILNCTQCQKGSVDMEAYATGKSLLDAGVISGKDITDEAALCKMFYLLSNYTSDQSRDLMLKNLRGEITLN